MSKHSVTRGRRTRSIDAAARLVVEGLEERVLLANFAGLANEYTGKLSAVQTALTTSLNAASHVPFLNNQLGNLDPLKLFPTATIDNLKSDLNAIAVDPTPSQMQSVIFGRIGSIIGDRDGNNTVNAADIGVTVAGNTMTIDLPLHVKVADFTAPLNFGLGLDGLPIKVTTTGTLKADVEMTAADVKFSFTVGGGTSFDPGTFTTHASVGLGAGSHLKGSVGILQADITDDPNSSGSKFDATFTATNLLGTPDVKLSGSAALHLKMALGAGEQFPGLGGVFNCDWSWANSDSRGSEPHVYFTHVGISLGEFVSKIVKPLIEQLQYATVPAAPLIAILKAPIPGISDASELFGAGKVTLESLVKDFKGELPPDWAQYVDLALIVADVSDIINKFALTGSNAFLDFGGFDLNDHNADLRDLPGVDYAKADKFGTDLTSLDAGSLAKLDIATIAQKLADQVPQDSFGFKEMADKLALQAANGADYSFPILDDPAGCVFKLLLGQDSDLAEFHAQFVTDAGFSKQTPFSVLGYGISVEGQVHIDSKFKVAYDTLGLRELFNSGDFEKVVDGFYIGADSHLDLSGHILAHLDVDGGLAGVNVSGGITEATSKIHINDSDLDGLGADGKARLFNGDLDPDCMFDASGVIKAGLKVNVHIGHTIPNPFGDDVFIGVSKDFGFDPVTLFKWDTTDANGCIKQPAHTAAAPPPPKLAELDSSTGKLTLYMGSNANKREGVGSNTDVAEDFRVTHTGGAPDDESVAVTAFGYTQNFQHVKSIFATAGVGNDAILIDDGILSPASLAGDQDDDKLTYLGTNACSLSGGAGNDSLTSAGGADSLSGDDGNDYINGGDGDNVVKAGAGNDTVYTGSGADDIEGNEGNDVIGSGAGKDTVKGNDGDDYIESGEDADEVHGGKGKDTVLAGAGNDTVTGDEDDDQLIGNADDDSITGGAGNDVICGDDVTFAGDNIGSLGTTGGKDALFGNDGSDVIFGQGGDDYIEGGGSGDLVFAGDGNDRVIGGASAVVSADGNDSLVGEGGNDVIIGDNGSISATGVVTLDSGNGDDNMSGGNGDDNMSGGDDADRMYGQGGADSMNGDAGNDYMEGNAGNDTMNGGDDDDKMMGGSSTVLAADGDDSMSGGDGADIMIGDDGIIDAVTLIGGNGADIMSGGNGNDSMWGQGGNDSMTGDANDDDMIGNNGNDNMNGGTGADVMLGDNGVITPGATALPEAPGSFVRNVNLNTNADTDGNDIMSGGDNEDLMFGQGGNDTMNGEGGMDSMQGNQGNDSMSGGAADDDLTGGSSVAGTPDGSDNISGDDGNDVIAGDNAVITRTVIAGNIYKRYTVGSPSGTGLGLENNAVIRSVTLLDRDTIGGADVINGGNNDDTVFGGQGNDAMNGNDGDDDLTGNFGADLINGGSGDDGIVGDNGTIVDDLLAGPGKTLAAPGNKLSALIDVGGTKRRLVTLEYSASDGNDVLIGGLGNDSVHGGGGADLINGDDPAVSPTLGGNDALFGDDGNDSVYGNAGGDHLYGGSGNDILDGGSSADTSYGGDGDDSLYADTKDDRLIDWFGNFNNFYVPGPGYGAPTIIRSPSPHDRNWLNDLATADGATDADRELVIVDPPSPANSGPGGRSK